VHLITGTIAGIPQKTCASPYLLGVEEQTVDVEVQMIFLISGPFIRTD